MSHSKERVDKTCLNCGAQLIGRYCQDCGQHNLEPKETFVHLIKHFFEDLTHFEGSLFVTVKYMFTKPGFITEQYVQGRRASFLNPIRMYLFVSAMFFLLYGSFTPEKQETKKRKSIARAGTTKLAEGIRELDDSFGDSTSLDSMIVKDDFGNVIFSGTYPKSVAAYDSIQSALPPSQRDGTINRYFTRKGIAAGEIGQRNKAEFSKLLMDKFRHSLPYMLFISVPFIAFILYLLYIRRRKNYYYVSHIIFTIHFYCFVFISLLFIQVVELGGKWGDIIGIILKGGCFIYLLLAMRYFYKQGWGKTFFKFLVFALTGMFFIGLLAAIFLISSFLNLAS